MHRVAPGSAAALAALLAFAVPAGAQWAEYPGAVRDPAAEARAAAAAPGSGVTPSVATSQDAFETVLAFYRARGREVAAPAAPGLGGNGHERELPSGWRRGARGPEAIASGIRIRHAIVILDGAAGIAESKDWVSITRPFVGNSSQHGDEIFYLDIRDTTGILRARRE